LVDEDMAENALTMGELLRAGLAAIQSPLISEIRGMGLMNSHRHQPSKP